MPYVELFVIVPFLRLVQVLNSIFILPKDLLALMQNVLRRGYGADRNRAERDFSTLEANCWSTEQNAVMFPTTLTSQRRRCTS